jgi:3-oxoacyl-[acyl-carrier protein] reductase
MMHSGRVAVVTGAAGAIGQAISRRLLAQDAHVILVDRDPSVAALAETHRSDGRSAESKIVDLASLDDVEGLAAELIDHHGRCDILVNNAGIHVHGDGGHLITTEETTNDTWELTMAVNVSAPFLLCRAFLPAMKEAGWGRIINVASRAGRSYSLGSSASYSASKAGLIGLTRTIAGEYARYGVTANTVAPGRTETPLMLTQSDEVQQAGLTEIPRAAVGKPDEIAAAVAFLASDDASNLVGAVLDVNGGTLMP